MNEILNAILPYLGNIQNLMPMHWSGTICMFVSILCGLAVGMERELKSKPAGLRTLAMICVGSTIFTLASIMISDPLFEGGLRVADRGRIAAQIVSGIGFLGAGAIIRERGAVTGLTTAATIWTVAAIGVVVGTGHVAAGFALTVIVLSMLTLVQKFERRVIRTCRYTDCFIYFKAEKGINRLRMLAILDRYHIPDRAWSISSEGGLEVMKVNYCHYHRQHRAFIFDVIEIPGVVEVKGNRKPREDIESDFEDELEQLD